MNSISYGYMNTSTVRLLKESEALAEEAAFIEIQVHDDTKLKEIQKSLQQQYVVSDKFYGSITIHGEGETDGRKKIQFSTNSTTARRQYVEESVRLYSTVIDAIQDHKVRRVIVHPDTLRSGIAREQQITNLADSLVLLSDALDKDCVLCVEPRGGDAQRKVLRNEIEDLKLLESHVTSIGARKLALCMDIAQSYIVHGDAGLQSYLARLKTIKIPILEFHVSDVLNSGKMKNRVAQEVGKGRIDWKQVAPSMLEHCNSLLIETLGGIGIFQRSKSFIASLM